MTARLAPVRNDSDPKGEPHYLPRTSADHCTLRSFGAFDSDARACRSRAEWSEFARSTGLQLTSYRIVPSPVVPGLTHAEPVRF